MQPFTFFISYRRQDTAPIALLLKYEIEKRIQFVRVCVDVEAVGLAERFPERIRKLIGESHCTIALISKNWMPPPVIASGQSHQLKGHDWVITELRDSLKLPIEHAEPSLYGLKERMVIPIFVDCEKRFDVFDLPADLFPSTRETQKASTTQIGRMQSVHSSSGSLSN